MILTTDDPILLRAERLMLLDSYEATRRSVQRAFSNHSNLALLNAIIDARRRIAIIVHELDEEDNAELRTNYKQRMSVYLAEHDVSLGHLRVRLRSGSDPVEIIEVPDWIAS